MKHNTVFKIIMIVSVLLTIAALYGCIFTISNCKIMNPDDTYEMKGTISKTAFPESGFVYIYTEEHDTVWIIDYTVTKFIELDEIEKLSKGDVITFCIDKDDYENYNENWNTDIVCIETEKGTVLSMDEYNSGMKKGTVFYLCGYAALGCIPLAGFIFSYKKLKKFKKGAVVNKANCSRELNEFENSDYFKEVQRLNSSRRYKIFMIGSVIVLLAFVALLKNSYINSGVDKDEFMEVQATVSNIKITETADGDLIEIHTEEHTNYWTVDSGAYDDETEKKIVELEQGEKIKIGVLKYASKNINNSIFLPIASLETETETIISMDDYTSETLESGTSVVAFLCIGCVACVVVFVINLIKYKALKDTKTGNEKTGDGSKPLKK